MDFVFLSTQGWDEMGGVGRPIHFLARELLARGERVLFVEVVASKDNASEKNFTRVNFDALGFDEHALRRAWFGLDPQIDSLPSFTRALDAFESPTAERVVVYADPFIPFLEWFNLFRARSYKIVYDALDDFEAFPEIGLYFANPDAEKFLVAHSDLVLAVSTTLLEKLSAWKHRAPIQLLRQGFDPQTFRAPRTERTPLRSPPRAGNAAPAPDGNAAASVPYVLGFWGHINAFNIDVAMIEYIARARPQWTIQLIGPIDLDPALPRVQKTLLALPNVQLVGHVAHVELPRYLHTFDVALVPFPANAFNRARDPLKVYEYLSGYKPIVAAHTPQLRGMPYLSVAESPQEFLDQIERALQVQVDRNVVDAYLAQCTWIKRLDQFLNRLAQITPAAHSPAPDIYAWYADTSPELSVREYIARTEQLLQERTAYVRALENEGRAKQTHIDNLQRFNPIWSLKSLFDLL